MAANINQIGRGCDKPSGLISQLLFSGAVGETPSGTSSFCEQITHHSTSYLCTSLKPTNWIMPTVSNHYANSQQFSFIMMHLNFKRSVTSKLGHGWLTRYMYMTCDVLPNLPVYVIYAWQHDGVLFCLFSVTQLCSSHIHSFKQKQQTYVNVSMSPNSTSIESSQLPSLNMAVTICLLTAGDC